jgi:hypothetical protein
MAKKAPSSPPISAGMLGAGGAVVVAVAFLFFYPAGFSGTPTIGWGDDYYGGWETEGAEDSLEMVGGDLNLCTIERRVAGTCEGCINKDEFLKNYKGKKPVLISGLIDDWSARTNWAKDNVLKKYRDAKVSTE